MARHELGDRLQVVHDGHNTRELTHVNLVALCAVDCRWQENVSECKDVAKAVLAFGLFHLGFEGCQAASQDETSPRLLVLIAESATNFLEHGQVLSGLAPSVDHFAKAAHLESLDRVFGKELSLARIDLFEVLADSHGLGERDWLLSNVLVFDNQGRYHL